MAELLRPSAAWAKMPPPRHRGGGLGEHSPRLSGLLLQHLDGLLDRGLLLVPQLHALVVVLEERAARPLQLLQVRRGRDDLGLVLLLGIREVVPRVLGRLPLHDQHVERPDEAREGLVVVRLHGLEVRDRLRLGVLEVLLPVLELPADRRDHPHDPGAALGLVDVVEDAGGHGAGRHAVALPVLHQGGLLLLRGVELGEEVDGLVERRDRLVLRRRFLNVHRLLRDDLRLVRDLLGQLLDFASWPSFFCVVSVISATHQSLCSFSTFWSSAMFSSICSSAAMTSPTASLPIVAAAAEASSELRICEAAPCSSIAAFRQFGQPPLARRALTVDRLDTCRKAREVALTCTSSSPALPPRIFTASSTAVFSSARSFFR